LKKLNLFLIISLIAFSGCQQNITIQLPNYTPKVAVDCILQDGTLPQLYLNLSTSYYSYGDTTNGYKSIKNAQVYITDQTANTTDSLVLDSFKYRGNSWQYIYSSKPTGRNTTQAGHHYVLKINYNGRFITAETTVPEPVKVDHFDYSLVNDPNNPPPYHNFNIYFYDLPGQGNYYSVTQIDSTGTSEYSDTDYISDLGFDGKLLEITTTDYDEQGNVEPPPYTHGFRINNASKELGKYITDINNQAFNSGPLNEPVTIESNINGGLGIFGAYTPSPIIYIHVK